MHEAAFVLRFAQCAALPAAPAPQVCTQPQSTAQDACAHAHNALSGLSSAAQAADFSEVAILFRRRKTGRLLQRALLAAKVPFNWHATVPHRLSCVRRERFDPVLSR